MSRRKPQPIAEADTSVIPKALRLDKDVLRKLAVTDRSEAAQQIRECFAHALQDAHTPPAISLGVAWQITIQHSTDHAGYKMLFKVTHAPLGVDTRPYVQAAARLWGLVVSEFRFILADEEYAKTQQESVGVINNDSFAKLFRSALQDKNGK